MTKSTLTSSYSGLVSLSSGNYANPLTIASGGSLGDSLYAPTAWTVTNYGVVNATANNAAVTFAAGGAFTNKGSGTVSAATGILFANHTAGTAVNYGQITASTNVSYSGIWLTGGGQATNAAGGVITGRYGIVNTFAAVAIVNAGSISASGFGIALESSTGSVTNTSGANVYAAEAGILAESTQAATLVNAGNVSGGGEGVALKSGALTNQSGGTIAAHFIDGVELEGTSVTVVNYGDISAPTGIYGLGGSGITNASGGTISGTFGVKFASSGGGGSAATLTNAGSISGSSDAILFSTLTNRLIVDPGAAFSGTVDGGNAVGAGHTSTLELASGASAGTLTSLGSRYIHFGAITVDASATWVLTSDSIASGYAITDGGTLTNAGTLGSAVTLGNGAVLTNAITGTIISGGTAVYNAPNVTGTVVNAGLITGTGTRGFGLALYGNTSVTNTTSGTIAADYYAIKFTHTATGTIVNSGTLSASTEYAIGMERGGEVINNSGGVIIGSGTASGMLMRTGPAGTYGTVINAGQITGGGTYGLAIDISTQVTNLSTGIISGGAYGVRVNANASAASTVTNAGTISGGQFAVQFLSDYANRQIVDPGAVFTGKVDGGFTSGATAVSTLELASAASAGTLTSLGSKYTRFPNITIDAGAQWTLTSETLSSGYTITDAGTLTNVGTLGSTVTLGSGAVLTNSGQITNTGSAAVYGTSAGAVTVVNSGQILDSSGSGAGINLADGGSVTNLSGGTILADYAIDATSAGTITIVNDGTIGDGTYGGGAGVYLSHSGGGTITNQTAGFIYSARYGVDVMGGLATIVNAGRISGTAEAGIGHAKLVTNLSTGTITGFNGISQAQTIVNYGSIGGTARAGVYFLSAGTLLNQASGVITGVTGVVSGSVINAGTISGATTSGGIGLSGFGAANTNLSTGTITGFTAAQITGTLVNAGLISGSAFAVRFATGNNDRLIVDPGATFVGAVNGENLTNGPNSSTLELASGASAGTFASLGNTVVNFVNVTVDAGAAWTLTGDTLPSGYEINVAGTLTNTGSLGSGVTLGSGAQLTNAAGGTVTSTGNTAVSGAGAVTVVNSGEILDSAAAGVGINLADGGAVTNLGGTIVAGNYGIRARSSGTTTVVNDGSISGGWAGAYLFAGTLTNQAAGVINGGHYGVKGPGTSTTIVNAGSIHGTTVAGLDLARVVTNLSTGTITGATGIEQTSTVVNYGSIGGSSHDGVVLVSSGTLLNQASGLITGVTGAAYGTVINAGTIRGATTAGGIGVIGADGAYITNLSTGTISGFGAAQIYGTLVNAGLISGSSYAVQFDSNSTNRLIVDPGATFIGVVNGENLNSSTLELASGASAGTFASLGNTVVNFANVTIDAGATWTLTGDTLPSGYTIADAGTLTNTGSLGSGVSLGSGALLTNAAGGTISASGTAVTGSSGSNTVVNAGDITASGYSNGSATISGYAVLLGGGFVTNQSGGTITGAVVGLYDVISAVTVVNAGGITAANAAWSFGIDLKAGGTVTNQSSGTISANYYGLYGMNTAFTVVNTGDITGLLHIGIYSGAGGTITNQSGGTISGGKFGVDGANAALTVMNAGSISGSSEDGIYLGAGGSVTNQSGGTISGINVGVYGNALAGTAINAGYIEGAGSDGIGFEAGGSVTNQSGGTIFGGNDGVYVRGSAGTVVNAGNITGTADYGIQLQAAGSVTNQSGGTISDIFDGVYITGTTAGTVVNAGYITGTQHYGVQLESGGSVTNQSGGTISGGNDGIALAGGGATVVNAGLISGATDAVSFAANVTNQLIVDPSASFIGTVDGGNTIGAGHTSTLELASGASAGTFSSLGNTAVHFAIVTIDAGAQWTLSSDTIASAYKITDAGTLTNTGSIAAEVTLGAAAQLVNASGGTIAVNTSSAAGAYLSDGGSVTNLSGGTISGKWGVLGKTAAFTVVNGGIISGPTNTIGYGVRVEASGTITNLSSGTISARYGIKATALATVVNYGSIQGATSGAYDAVELLDGGSVTNASGGSIAGEYGVKVFGDGNSGTILNAGVIAGNASGDPGVYDREAGVFSNQSTGTISGQHAVELDSGGLGATISALNAGLISGNTASGGFGVGLYGAGSFTNQAGGTITGNQGLEGKAGAATVANAGSIGGTAFGVSIAAGGTITNLSGGVISGGTDAVTFASGSTNRLVVDPGATFTGTVDGGNTVGAASTSTLELASGASGGTLTSLGAQYVNFAQVTVDSGATWSFGSTDTVAAGTTLTNAGTIAGGASGVSLAAGAALTNASGATITSTSNGAIYGNNAGYVTVVNSGKILSGGASDAISLPNGVLITNTTGGTIIGSEGALFDGTMVNAGSIAGTGDVGVSVVIGTVTNQSSGTISGRIVGIFGGTGGVTITNAGVISGGTYAIEIGDSSYGRVIVDPGAVFNGTVDGDSTDVVLELASGASGGTLSGLGSQYIGFGQTTIDAGAHWTLTGATNTLASRYAITNLGTLTLSNATLNDSGTIVNNGGIVIDPSSMTISSLIGTGTVTIAANSTLDVTGTVGSGETIDFATTSGAFYLTPGTNGVNFAGTIAGFATGDTIGLNGITDVTGVRLVNSNGTLAITTSSEGTIDLAVSGLQVQGGTTFQYATSGGNTVITAEDLPCFVAGTLIDTPAGPVAVEDLREGDVVCTASGGERPVRWIGYRHLDLTRHPDPRRAQPIRVLADAIADGAPRRDLLVSPDHALFLNGRLIAARLLRNDATIRQENVRAVTYYHVELDAHDILLAEGLAAESYLDTGNRGTFENADAPLTLHPDFTKANDQARRVAESCAPFVDDAALVEKVWRRIAQRAAALGHVLPSEVSTTDDPALHVMINGQCIRPIRIDADRYVFLLPPMPASLHLVSRHAVPSEAQPWIEDQRRLGVMVREIVLVRDAETLVVPMDHPGLVQGWWAIERIAGTQARWTDGHARLEIPEGGLTQLEVALAASLPYPLSLEPARTTKAA